MRKIFALMLAIAMVLTMVACGKKADNKADSMVTPELYISTVDGKDTVVNKDGKAVTGYTLDKDGNVVDDSGKLVLAAQQLKALPNKAAESKPETDTKTDVKTDAKPADGSDPDSGSSSIGSSDSGSGSSGSSSSGSSSSGNSGSSSGGSSSDSGSSGSSTPAAPDPTPVHQHSWEPVYRTVEDYETQCRTICVNCGEDITGNVTAHTKQEMLAGNSGQSRQEYNTIVVGEHQEIDYYVCSCGETKAP